MSFLSSTRQQSRCSSYRILCHVLRKINQQCSGLRTPHIKVTAPERSTTSAYRMRLNVSLFRNHLSASKYRYKKVSPTCPPLPSLPPPPCLSSLPFFSPKVSLFWSSRCVFRCIFQGRSFFSKSEGGSFRFIFQGRSFLPTPRCVIFVFEGRSFRFKSQGGSFCFIFPR